MKALKGTIKACISLSKSTCYMAERGTCSLELVSNLFLSSSIRTPANDLLFCPRLYKAMLAGQSASGKEKNKPIVVTACECGHAEVISGHQRACIASKTGITVPIKFIDKNKPEKACSLCGGQITLYKEASDSVLVNLKIKIEEEKKG